MSVSPALRAVGREGALGLKAAATTSTHVTTKSKQIMEEAKVRGLPIRADLFLPVMPFASTGGCTCLNLPENPSAAHLWPPNADVLVQKLMPGGVSSPVRAFKSVGGEPIVFDKVEGAYCFDV